MPIKELPTPSDMGNDNNEISPEFKGVLIDEFAQIFGHLNPRTPEFRAAVDTLNFIRWDYEQEQMRERLSELNQRADGKITTAMLKGDNEEVRIISSKYLHLDYEIAQISGRITASRITSDRGHYESLCWRYKEIFTTFGARPRITSLLQEYNPEGNLEKDTRASQWALAAAGFVLNNISQGLPPKGKGDS